MSSQNSGEGSKTTKKRRRTQERCSVPKEGNTASRVSSEKSLSKDSDDPFRGEQGFHERAERLSVTEWVEACRLHTDQMEETTTDIEAMLSEYFCGRCREKTSGVMARVGIPLRKQQFALEEYARRYLRMSEDLDRVRREEARLVKDIERNAEMAEGQADEFEELRDERDELCTSLAAREEELDRLTEEKEKGKQRRDQLRALLATRVEDLKRMAEEKEEVVRERDRLRAALATKEEDSRRMAEDKEEAERERDRLRAALIAREEEDRERETRVSLSLLSAEPEEAVMRGEVSPLTRERSTYRPF